MKKISSISGIADRYDAFILDLWGVVHDGSHLYPGVHETMVNLRKAGKKIIMLSNAPRRACKVEKVLNALGIEPALYDAVISSGEVGYLRLAATQEMGRNFYYIGPEGTHEWTDADILDGLDYERARRIHQADFLLNVGFGSEQQSTEDVMPLLREARALKLPMICLNPDLEVVKQTGQRFPCAGVIAHAYQNIGGAVAWFGKPYGEVYEQCMTVFGGIPKARVLAVGDSLETDMPGAKHFGIDAVLVTGGILKQNTPEEIEAMCYELSLKPQYVMPQLKW